MDEGDRLPGELPAGVQVCRVAADSAEEVAIQAALATVDERWVVLLRPGDLVLAEAEVRLRAHLSHIAPAGTGFRLPIQTVFLGYTTLAVPGDADTLPAVIATRAAPTLASLPAWSGPALSLVRVLAQSVSEAVQRMDERARETGLAWHRAGKRWSWQAAALALGETLGRRYAVLGTHPCGLVLSILAAYEAFLAHAYVYQTEHLAQGWSLSPPDSAPRTLAEFWEMALQAAQAAELPAGSEQACWQPLDGSAMEEVSRLVPDEAVMSAESIVLPEAPEPDPASLLPGITAIVHTLNEEKKLEAALQSLQGWVDQIIVCDMESTDRTLAIAHKYADLVLTYPRVRQFEKARNYSRKFARHQWVYVLDADERVPEGLGPLLRETAAQQPENVGAIALPFRNFFMGTWVRNLKGWWPGYKAPPLLRTSSFRWNEFTHGGPKVHGQTVYMRPDPIYAITHLTYEDITECLRKTDRYTTTVAAEEADQGHPFQWKHAAREAMNTMWVYYEQTTSGHEDGAVGFILTIISGFYDLVASCKLFAHRSRQGSLTALDREIPLSSTDFLEEMVAAYRDLASKQRVDKGPGLPTAETGAAAPQTHSKPGITAIVRTLNEEAKVEDALRSLQGQVEEIIVCDMESDDRTVEIAQKYADKILTYPRQPQFEGMREFSVRHAEHAWVFFLDADERVPARLWPVIRNLIRTVGDDVAAIRLPYHNFFGPAWIRHTGEWWPGYKAPPLLRNGRFTWPSTTHSMPDVNGRTLYLPILEEDPAFGITHLNYDDVSHYLRKLDRYTTTQAEDFEKAGMPYSWREMARWMVHEFHRMYAPGAAKDGALGLLLSQFASTYILFTYAKLYERRLRSGRLTPEEQVTPANLVELLEFMLAEARQLEEQRPTVPAHRTTLPLLPRYIEVMDELVAYTGVSLAEIERRIAQAVTELSEVASKATSESSTDLAQYLATQASYLYFLVQADYGIESQPRVADLVAYLKREALPRLGADSHQRILVCDAGIGSICLGLSDVPGVSIVHADYPGPHTEFARWRYTQRAINPVVVDISADNPLGEQRFDLIVWVGAGEREPEAVGVVDYLAGHLRPAGLLALVSRLNPPLLPFPKKVETSLDTLTQHLLLAGFTRISSPTSQSQVPYCHLLARPPLPGLVVRGPAFAGSRAGRETRELTLALATHLPGVVLQESQESEESSPLADLPAALHSQLLALIQAAPLLRCVSLQVGNPLQFRRLAGASRQVGRTAWTEGLPREWLTRLQQLDEVWVPTEYHRQQLVQAGMPEQRVVVVPSVAAPLWFDKDVPPLPLAGARRIVFLATVGGNLHSGWDTVLRAYTRAFVPGDDVTLVLYCEPSPAADLGTLEQQVMAFLLEDLGLAEDQVPDIALQPPLSPEELPSLYRAAHAFLWLPREDDYGHAPLAALAAGIPVVTHNYGALAELVPLDAGYHVEATSARADSLAGAAGGGEVSVESLIEVLQHIARQPEDAQQRGKRAQEVARARHSWEAVAEVVSSRLREWEAPQRKTIRRRSPGGATNGAYQGPRPRTGLTVVWEGPQFIHFGMAQVNREICRVLAEWGTCDLHVAVTEQEQQVRPDRRFEAMLPLIGRAPQAMVDVHVRHTWPPNFQPPQARHYVIFQPWEYGALPVDWLEPMRERAAEVWVYTNYLKETYVQSGVPAEKIHVIPCGVDPSLFHPDVIPLQLPTKKHFRFLFVGGSIPRKGIDILLDCYLRAFSAADDVCLVVKDFAKATAYRDRNLADHIGVIAQTPGAPEILYLDQDLSPQEVAGLYAACSCLVHPYRAEGFALPVAEAMAVGLPVIVPNHGAVLDFVDPQTGYLVPAVEEVVPQKHVGEMQTVDNIRFTRIDRDALVATMRALVEDQARGREVGQRAARKIAQEFTWEKAAARVMERLRALVGNG